ncbi:MAG TPA: hypothetical protein VFF06_21330 [Polyangia bacterium]|nr:hypothetical protein [Polyangia bacterium]
MQTFLEIVLPAIVIFTTLFGLLSRGDPRPGGVALFWRVGLTGLALGGILFYVTFRTSAFANLPAFVSHLYYGLLIGGTLLTLFAAAGTALKKKET